MVRVSLLKSLCWIRRLIFNRFELKVMSSSRSPPPPPLVVVLGSTGVGKSQLAIEIAKKFNGEIISADSMQVYKGLDIITNKVTAEEMCGIPHHVLDFLDPLKEFTVVDFRNRALPILERLRAAGKMPIVVGGTNYYIESIIWETLVTPYGDNSEHNDKLVAEVPTDCDPSESTASLYSRLKEIDPERARMLHPNDRRKIERSLQVFHKQKIPQSEIFSKQRKRGGVLGGPLRYSDAIVFWIQCQQDVLEARLDARVDKMIDQGLIDELLNFHTDYNARRGENCDYTQGIFQSIGFKEFHPYLISSVENRNSKAGKKMFDNNLGLMKQVTKRYSKTQKKWINKRFLGEPEREVPPMFGLDGTDLAAWDSNVRDTAIEIMNDILAGRQPKTKPLEKIDVVRSREGILTCDICSITCVGAVNWNAHMTSKKHYKQLASKKKAAEQSQMKGAAVDGRHHQDEPREKDVPVENPHTDEPPEKIPRVEGAA